MSELIRINALRALGREEEAKRVVVAAFRKAGNKRDAAAALGCNASTLYRLINALDLWSALDALAEGKGWRGRAGRPRGPLADKPAPR
jgi:hypothetical protein